MDTLEPRKPPKMPLIDAKAETKETRVRDADGLGENGHTPILAPRVAVNENEGALDNSVTI